MGRARQVAARSITRQAAVRLVLSLGLLVLLVGATTSYIYRATLGKAAEERAGALADFYRARLAQFDRDWDVQSRAFKVRIETSRLLEEQPPNLSKLQAHMTVQGVNRRFQYLLIQDRQKHRVFSFGTDLDLPAIPLADEAENGWYLDPVTGNLFHVFVEKVWLGERGQGRMATFYRLDNGILKQLATPGIELTVVYRGKPVASSSGQAGIEEFFRHTRRESVGEQHGEIPWGDAPNDVTRLHIDAPIRALFSPTELIVGGSLIPIVDGLILWFTLGIWLMRNARRITGLGGAVDEFARQHSITARMEAWLENARGRQKDEIDEVATAVEGMARQAVRREQEHVATEKLLRRSEQRFRDIAESAGEFIWEADARHAFLFLSEKAVEVFGLPLDRLVGGNIFDHIPPDEHAHAHRRIDELMEAGKPFKQFELHIRRPDGERRWVAFTGTPVPDEDGRRTGTYRGTAEDVTQRKRSEESLLLAEKVFANSDQAILITDPGAAIVSVNPAFSEITGYTAEEAIGRNPRMFSSGRHDAAFYAAMWGELRRSGAWTG